MNKIYNNIIKMFDNWNIHKDDYEGMMYINIYNSFPNAYRIKFDNNKELKYYSNYDEYDLTVKFDISKFTKNIKKLIEKNKDIVLFNYSFNELCCCSLNENRKFLFLISSAPNNYNYDFLEVYTDNIDDVYNYLKDCFEICDKENLYEFGIASVDITGALYTSYYDYKYKEIDIEKNYNDDLPYDKICEIINKENTPDLLLFYGEPGTGKSSLIKHLICKYRNKDWVFIDGNILGNAPKDKLMSYFLENPNTIFILEDCEKILVSREQEYNPIMSVLLNITDSTISDILGIKIICTFNTSLSNIDKALLRKGRLSLKYKFDKLSSKKVSQILGYNYNSDMTLADLYNINDENDFSKKPKKTIGFN